MWEGVHLAVATDRIFAYIFSDANVPFIAFLADTCTETGPKAVKPILDLQKAAVGAFAALTIASSAFTVAPPAADALPPAFFSSTTLVAEKEIREGLYREYEVDAQPQKYDDARSTFKAASETKSKKGKYCSAFGLRCFSFLPANTNRSS